MSQPKKDPHPPVIVINNEARILQYQTGHGESHGRLDLKPGANEVSGELWARVLKNCPSVETQMRTPSTNPEVHGAMMLEISSGLPAVDAIGADKLLRTTYDRKLIERWAAEESRDDVRMLCTRRLDEIDRIAREAAKQTASEKPQKQPQQ